AYRSGGDEDGDRCRCSQIGFGREDPQQARRGGLRRSESGMAARRGKRVTLESLKQQYQSGMRPVDIVTAIYDRIEKHPLAPVWIPLVPRAQALERAAELHAGPQHLPLFGVPFAVKDNIDVAGLPTTAGCPAFSFHPQTSATVVTKLQEA